MNRGRAAAENIYSERLGTTSYSQRGVQSGSALRLFVDEPMLCFIQKFTVKHEQVDKENVSVELREFKNSLVFR